MPETRSVYLSLSDLRAMVAVCEDKAISYFRLDWENAQIWHNISIVEMPFGKSIKICSDPDEPL